MRGKQSNGVSGLIRILDRDLVAAGLARRVKSAAGKWIIDKRDERGRTIDVHALRHTFGTMLSKGGVMPRTAQAAMRHSDVNLTMNVYTDPKLLDIAGALNSLPALPLAGIVQSEPNGGDVASENRELAPLLAPTAGRSGQKRSIPDKCGQVAALFDLLDHLVVTSSADKHLRPLSLADNGRLRERAKGLEPSTSSLGIKPGNHLTAKKFTCSREEFDHSKRVKRCNTLQPISRESGPYRRQSRYCTGARRSFGAVAQANRPANLIE